MPISKRTLKDPIDAFQLQPLVDDLTNSPGVRMVYTGNGTPEGQIKAKIGALYLRQDGGASSVLYVKETDDEKDIGWVAK